LESFFLFFFEGFGFLMTIAETLLVAGLLYKMAGVPVVVWTEEIVAGYTRGGLLEAGCMRFINAYKY